MAWRIYENVVKGEIDNRTRGRVSGRVWLATRDKPLVLDLSGNCLRDLAGCLIQFENPSPIPGDTTDLVIRQTGRTGDMTASRKVRVLDVPIGEAMRLAKAGSPVPEHMGNCLYLEWFSEANGRVVLESTDYKITVTAPEWTLSRAEEKEQAGANHEAIRNWIGRLGEASPEEFDPKVVQPPDEFECERFLKESDERTDKYGALLEKYRDHPECEKIIAREMGWEWLEETEEAYEQGAFSKLDEPEEIEPLVPNPATEGIDWIRDGNGHVRHPLSLRVFETSVAIQRFCEAGGLLESNGDPDLCDMIFHFQTTGAKLAGALNRLAYHDLDFYEDGFIVARLKRALHYLHQSIAAWDKVVGKNLLPSNQITAFRGEQFAVREEILALMKKFRGE
ncbi:MAG: hypothetical protein WCH43_00880 [Verrucomicrobiota bacterium]